jgi:hypothetical protein
MINLYSSLRISRCSLGSPNLHVASEVIRYLGRIPWSWLRIESSCEIIWTGRFNTSKFLANWAFPSFLITSKFMELCIGGRCKHNFCHCWRSCGVMVFLTLLQAHCKHDKQRQQQQSDLAAAAAAEAQGTEGSPDANGAIPTRITSHHRTPNHPATH